MNAIVKTKKVHPTRSPDRTADERFFHIKGVRREYENGRVVTAITAFTRVDKDGVTYASFAERDDRDTFNRRRGRVVARRKWMLRDPNKRIQVPAKATYEQLLDAWEAK